MNASELQILPNRRSTSSRRPLAAVDRGAAARGRARAAPSTAPSARGVSTAVSAVGTGPAIARRASGQVRSIQSRSVVPSSSSIAYQGSPSAMPWSRMRTTPGFSRRLSAWISVRMLDRCARLGERTVFTAAARPLST